MGHFNSLIGYDHQKFENIIIPSIKEGIDNVLVKDEFEKGVEHGEYSQELYDKFHEFNQLNISGTAAFVSTELRKTEAFIAFKTLFENLFIKHCAKVVINMNRLFPLWLFFNESTAEQLSFLFRKLEFDGSFWNRDGMDGITGWIDWNALEILFQSIEKDDLIMKTGAFGEERKQHGAIIDGLYNFFSFCIQQHYGVLSINATMLKYSVNTASRLESYMSYLIDGIEGNYGEECLKTRLLI